MGKRRKLVRRRRRPRSTSLSSVQIARLWVTFDAARRRALAFDRIIESLPGPWRQAAQLLADSKNPPLGLSPALYLARAFCDWYLDEDRRRADSNNRWPLLRKTRVESFKEHIEKFLGRQWRAGRGRPRRRLLAREDYRVLKAEYQRRLQEARKERGPVGEEGRKELVKSLAVESGYPNWRKLYEQLFAPSKFAEPHILTLEELKQLARQSRTPRRTRK